MSDTLQVGLNIVMCDTATDPCICRLSTSPSRSELLTGRTGLKTSPKSRAHLRSSLVSSSMKPLPANTRGYVIFVLYFCATFLIQFQWFIQPFEEGYQIRNAGSEYWAAACGDQVVRIPFLFEIKELKICRSCRREPRSSTRRHASGTSRKQATPNIRFVSSFA